MWTLDGIENQKISLIQLLFVRLYRIIKDTCTVYVYAKYMYNGVLCKVNYVRFFGHERGGSPKIFTNDVVYFESFH